MEINPLAAVGSVLGTVSTLLNNLTQNTPTNGGHFVVNHDNVLAAAKIIQNQADELRATYTAALEKLEVAPPGEDEVSVRMAKEWNQLLVRNGDSYAKRVRDYVAGLDNLVAQLTESAREYGYNEDQVASALGGSAVV
ncbi:PE domain-containing protein [Actinokineospora pegani]|uniref:PE domain-containing protein n=1 Tax=Actinokineospora pegani TaxID=2654637 RepID=UPI0012EAF654|nr:PE domain-containing protein [Actinokineospora pegani]